MAVLPVVRPCWVVTFALAEWEAHHPTFDDAVDQAAEWLTEELYDSDRVPFVEARRCWRVVCLGCRVPVDEDDELGQGCHYGVSEALEVNAALCDAGLDLCGECETAAALGSVAAANGRILPARVDPERPVRPGIGQLPLFDPAGVAA
jgi:hypothetical protein